MEGLEDDLQRESSRRNTLEVETISLKDTTRSVADMETEVDINYS